MEKILHLDTGKKKKVACGILKSELKTVTYYREFCNCEKCLKKTSKNVKYKLF